jgi:hypothetical protein
MVTISNLGQSYGVIAPETISGYQLTLNKLAAYAGTTPPPTQISLSNQAAQLAGFGRTLDSLATSNSSFEDTRGLATISKLQADFAIAYKTASSRLTVAGLNANTQQNAGRTTAGLIGGASNISDVVSSYLATPNNKKEYDVFGNEVGGNSIFTAIGKALKSQNTRTNAALSLLGVYNRNKAADPYARKEPTKYSASGSTKIDVKVSNLTSQIVDIPLAKGLLPGNKFQIVTTTSDNTGGSSSQGISSTITTSNQNTTVAVDTNDPVGDDTRTTNLNLNLGDGSNVAFVSGSNDSTIRVGSGNNFVVAEGNSTIYGGSGDSILVGKNVISGKGNDTIFSSGFAYGGEGDDYIVLFNPSKLTDPKAPLPLAIGGSGNNTILANIKANVIGGQDNNNIILREGGSASSGDGKNVISAEGSAEVTVGNGNNDIHLVKGGSIIVGNGNNTLVSRTSATITVGSGVNDIELRQGGTVNYAVGGKVNALAIGKSDPTIVPPPINKINLTGLLYSDTTTSATLFSASIKQNSGSLGGFNVSIADAAINYTLHFSKNGQAQDVTISGGLISVGSIYAGV